MAELCVEKRVIGPEGGDSTNTSNPRNRIINIWGPKVADGNE